MMDVGIGVAIIEASRILLTKRRDLQVWCIPGGHLLDGESVFNAAVREAKEETGLDIELTGVVGIYSLPEKGERGSWEVILRARPIGGRLVKSTNETTDAAYFAQHELPSGLIGWQTHQARDALIGASGVLVVLDVRVSVLEIREQELQAREIGRPVSNAALKALCTVPERIDLPASMGM